MQYFARFSAKNNPSNQLQKYILSQIERFDNILLDDPSELFKLIEAIANQSTYTYRRCTPLPARAFRDHKTKQITSIGAGGLFVLNIHKVLGHYPPLSEAQTVTAAQTAASEPPPQEPAPAPTSRQPRQEVWQSRDHQRVVRFESWDKFTPDVQTLLQTGKIWGIYENLLGQAVAEEYGGKTQPAYAA